MAWKVKDFLSRHNKTPYALWKAVEGDLSRNTVYAIAAGEPDGVNFKTLTTLITGMEKLTGQTVALSDVIEVVREPVAA